jgi:UrcA family protein
MNILRSSVLILAAAAAFNLHADDGDIRQVRVSYAGLDLETRAGAEILFRRIKAAARSVCIEMYGKQDLEQRYRWKQCVNEAIARAVTDVDASTLTTYYLAQQGKAPKPVALAAGR